MLEQFVAAMPDEGIPVPFFLALERQARMHRTYQMARVLGVASRIYHQPRQWTRPRLADSLGVNKATMQRDIDLLREIQRQEYRVRD